MSSSRKRADENDVTLGCRSSGCSRSLGIGAQADRTDVRLLAPLQPHSVARSRTSCFDSILQHLDADVAVKYAQDLR